MYPTHWDGDLSSESWSVPRRRAAHFCVPLDFESRCAAALELIRPEEVRHWISVLPPGYAAPAPFADQVALRMRQEFAAGRLRYMPDPPSCDRWSSPAETLRRGGEDCDGLAILVTSLLAWGTARCEFVVGHLCDGWQACGGHAWAEGIDEAGWFLLEATSGALHRQQPTIYKPAMHVRPSGGCRRAR
jgi:hypothetical protein